MRDAVGGWFHSVALNIHTIALNIHIIALTIPHRSLRPRGYHMDTPQGRNRAYLLQGTLLIRMVDSNSLILKPRSFLRRGALCPRVKTARPLCSV